MSRRRKRPPAELITWRREGCGCAVLRVTLTATGWRLSYPRFRQTFPAPPPSDWPAGYEPKMWSRVHVQDGDEVLPLDVDEWPAALLDLNCSEGRIIMPVDLLAFDVLSARLLRREITRNVSPATTETLLGDGGLTSEEKDQLHNLLPDSSRNRLARWHDPDQR